MTGMLSGSHCGFALAVGKHSNICEAVFANVFIKANTGG
jgi:hypothetical protein